MKAGRGDNASYLTGEKDTFSWQTDYPLLSGQAFELVFWPENVTPGKDTGRAETEADALYTRLSPVPAGAGRYTWGVILVQQEPYLRLRYLDKGGSFVVSEPGASDAGGSPPKATEDPNSTGEKPPEEGP